MKRPIFTLLVFTIAMGLYAQKLMTNAEAYQQMLKQYEIRKTEFQAVIPEFFTHCDTIADQELKEAVQFLIAYSPLSDLGNLDVDYFRRHAELDLKTRYETPWGKDIPSDVFMHFVLPFRVNNENPDEARTVFQAEIMPRIEGMEIYEAALEVNHWCLEKVTYKSTDIRTSAPLSTMKTAFGRCGEESTFTVAALRSVGIPSRQVYTPRWAHTDDNHAWVEVYVDGKWYFMGACEPAPELNMGWFAVPATRAIMMHTNTFGKYLGDEKTLQENDLFSQLNLLSNYAPTKTATITIVDEAGKPMEGIDVDFMVYNYAEFYPFARFQSDEKGQAEIETGFGDLLVWVTNGESYSWAELEATATELEIILPQEPIPFKSTHKDSKESLYDMTITPPSAGEVVVPETSKAEEHKKRMAEDNAIRAEYEATFPDSAELAEKYADDPNKDEIIPFVLQSRGNYKEIMGFYIDAKVRYSEHKAIQILSQLPEKDLRDVPASILINHLVFEKKYQAVFCDNSEFYIQYILSPRIGYEIISPWRNEIQEFFKKGEIQQFRVKPIELAEWFQKNIELDNKNNYYRTPLFPESTLKLKKADYYSRNIAFVATCRSLGIPARLDQATNRAQYFDGQWNNAFPENEMLASLDQGTLIIESFVDNAKYYTHYTIAKLKDGRFRTLDYEYDGRLNHFPCTLNLDPGTYRMMTGNRQKDGSVLTRWSFFDVVAGETITEYVVFNENTSESEILFKLQQSPCEGGWDSLGTDRDLYSPYRNISENGLVMALINPETEPGKHFLSELQQHKEEFSLLETPVNLVMIKEFRYQEELVSKWLALSDLPENTNWIIDAFGCLDKDMNEALPDGFELPLVLYMDKDKNVYFKSSGYAVNTVQMLMKTIRNIQ
ncbi:MAG: transglutaminase domain-containing protein [Bacteroidales bacterium]|nr:transglutaminase domain-containing protein [Bacteroidales bacterium]